MRTLRTITLALSLFASTLFYSGCTQSRHPRPPIPQEQISDGYDDAGYETDTSSAVDAGEPDATPDSGGLDARVEEDVNTEPDAGTGKPPVVCIDGDIREIQSCGPNKRGISRSMCVDGAWGEYSECVPADVCQLGQGVEEFYDGTPGTAGVGECVAGTRECQDVDGVAIYVGLTPQVVDIDETCNGKDDDCDGLIDEDYNVGAVCEVGEFACRSEGTTQCSEDEGGTICADAEIINPQQEVCNGEDDDCDGEIDEDLRCALIVFERDEDIYTMAVDGGNQINLTDTPDVLDFDPQWSPDGQKILYHSRHNAGNVDINVMDVDGENKQQLTEPLRETDDSLYGRWSPDGSMIAFLSERHQVPGDRLEIYLMDSDGQNQRRVAPHGIGNEPDSGLAWASNGQKVVIVSQRNIPGVPGNVCDGNSQSRLAVYDLQTEELEHITPCQNQKSRWTPNVSPDGRSVTYVTRFPDRGDNGLEDRFDLTKMSVNGRQEVEIIGGLEVHEFSPVYSPNGELIAVIRAENNQRFGDIYTVSSNGGESERVTEGAQAVRSQAMWDRAFWGSWLTSTYLSWSSDNREVLFTSRRDGNYEIYKVNVEDGVLQRLTENNGIDMSGQFQPIQE